MEHVSISSLRVWRIVAPAFITAVASAALYLTGAIGGFEWLRAKCGILGAMSEWTPSLAAGFVLDVALTVASGFIGTILGGFMAYAAFSRSATLRRVTWIVVQCLRNTPGLVLLFAIAFGLPFEFSVGGTEIPFPAEAKVIVCFSLKIAANVSEIIRGVVNATPNGQWDAGAAIGLSRGRIFQLVILPQCLPQMVPSWMNTMALFFTVVPIASLVGVYDAVNYAGLAINSEGSSDLIMPMYLYVLVWFYSVAYMLQELTKILEKNRRNFGEKKSGSVNHRRNMDSFSKNGVSR